MQRVDTVKQSRQWSSLCRQVGIDKYVQRTETAKQLGPWSSLGPETRDLWNLDVKFDIEGQCQSIPKTIGILINVLCIFCLNLVALELFHWRWVMAWTSSKCGKIWLFSSILPWRSRSIAPQNVSDHNQGLFFYTSDPDIVILAGMGDEFSRGKGRGWHTDGRTDRQT